MRRRAVEANADDFSEKQERLRRFLNPPIAEFKWLFTTVGLVCTSESAPDDRTANACAYYVNITYAAISI